MSQSVKRRWDEPLSNLVYASSAWSGSFGPFGVWPDLGRTGLSAAHLVIFSLASPLFSMAFWCRSEVASDAMLDHSRFAICFLSSLVLSFCRFSFFVFRFIVLSLQQETRSDHHTLPWPLVSCVFLASRRLGASILVLCIIPRLVRMKIPESPCWRDVTCSIDECMQHEHRVLSSCLPLLLYAQSLAPWQKWQSPCRTEGRGDGETCMPTRATPVTTPATPLASLVRSLERFSGLATGIATARNDLSCPSPDWLATATGRRARTMGISRDLS